MAGQAQVEPGLPAPGHLDAVALLDQHGMFALMAEYEAALIKERTQATSTGSGTSVPGSSNPDSTGSGSFGSGSSSNGGGFSAVPLGQQRAYVGGRAVAMGQRGDLGVAAEPAACLLDRGEVADDNAVRRRQQARLRHHEPRPGAPQWPVQGGGAVLVQALVHAGGAAAVNGGLHEPLEVAWERPDPEDSVPSPGPR